VPLSTKAYHLGWLQVYSPER